MIEGEEEGAVGTSATATTTTRATIEAAATATMAATTEPGAPSAEKAKLCPDYIKPEGCSKGDACELTHPVAPNGTSSVRVCSYYMSERGCSKDAR